MAQDLSSRRALIVDDEFLIAFDLEASMHELGFDVCNVASNEKDAKELAMSNPPDVVVMDVYLGGARTGIETARWLKEVCDVPIVSFAVATNASRSGFFTAMGRTIPTRNGDDTPAFSIGSDDSPRY
jgi:DNA-binding NarL/FixJ family response regulator